MNHEEFLKRLTFVIKIRKTFNRQQLIDLLNSFWKYNKSILNTEYLYYCYNILINIKNKFDTIIEESNRRYSFVYSKVLL